MKHYLLLVCENICYFTDNAGWIISEILFVFFNVNEINQLHFYKK